MITLIINSGLMKTHWDYCALVSSVAGVHSPGLLSEASLFHPEYFKRGNHANISARLSHRGWPQLQGSAELSGYKKNSGMNSVE
ncbi:Uncharacterized protein DAT39_005199 [Clarias magur]|uniref:Uncharacterized protein n=1 Tax=Clarias magur TaxID=1594786 RepID=A0A8J4XE25_CLAMG|nr:Uncharacterized protein DAT39_005199 [Clarias magur]